MRDFATTVGHDDHSLEGRVLAEFLVHREKDVVDKKEAIASVIGDAGNFVGMKPQIQSVQDAAGTGNTEEGFEVAGVIPHHGGDAITGTEAELGESRGQAARAVIEVAVTGAEDGTIGAPGDDFDTGEKLVGTLEERGEGQGKVHHRAAHENLREPPAKSE